MFPGVKFFAQPATVLSLTDLNDTVVGHFGAMLRNAESPNEREADRASPSRGT